MTTISRTCGGCGRALPLAGIITSCPHCGVQLRGANVTTVRQPVNWRLLFQIAGVLMAIALVLALFVLPMARARHRPPPPRPPPAPERLLPAEPPAPPPPPAP